ncbi:MAG: alpha/beta hydrolase-fold protein [Flavobacteriales bacterium]
MLRFLTLSLCCGLQAVCSAPLFAQLTLHVESIPANTPPGSSLFAAGNFNGWDPANAQYALTDDGDGSWSLTFTPPVGTVEFKFTRGDWSQVEGNANGGFQPNHTVAYDGSPTAESLDILSWEDLESGSGSASAGPGVEVLTPDFFIPQLERYRTIRIYTPPGYADSEQHYRVLYMHDGQNCFDVATSFAGEWEVDEALDALHAAGDPGCIVVAIDNGGIHRFDEYNPWTHPQYGGGEGDAYVDFLVETLKPWVDEHYRTLPEREHTGIAGSSMGGLISQYAAFRETGTFSRVGVFSPAYWTADPVFDFIAAAEHPEAMRVYTVVGELEGPAYVGDVVDMDAAMTSSGLETEEFLTVIHADGEHAEWYWAREFPAVYQWLWANGSASGMEDDITSDASGAPFTLAFSSDSQHILLRAAQHLDVGRVVSVEMLDVDGRMVLRSAGWTDRLPMSGYGPGLRVVRLRMDDGALWSRGLAHP